MMSSEGVEQADFQQRLQSLRREAQRTAAAGRLTFYNWVMLIGLVGAQPILIRTIEPKSLLDQVGVFAAIGLWVTLSLAAFRFDQHRRWCIAQTDDLAQSMQEVIASAKTEVAGVRAMIVEARNAMSQARARLNLPLIPGDYGPLISVLSGLLAAVATGLLGTI